MSQAVGHLVSQATTLGLTPLPASSPPPPSLFFPQMWQTRVLDSQPPVSSLPQTCQTEDLLTELKVRGRETGELSREERAMTFLSSKQRGDTMPALGFFLKWHQQPTAQASPGDRPHHPCLPAPSRSPQIFLLLCFPWPPSHLGWGSLPAPFVCPPGFFLLAPPTRDFSFSYEAFDKTFAWLKIKRREASCLPLCPLRDAAH